MAITQESIDRAKRLDDMWQSGKTIGEINEKFKLITILPEHLRSVNKDTEVDFSKRIQGWNNIKVSRLLLRGFHVIVDGKDSKHSLAYTTFKHMRIVGQV